MLVYLVKWVVNNPSLCDKKQCIKVTINGQLFLLMLIEKLELAGIHIISANTDGIVSIILER